METSGTTQTPLASSSIVILFSTGRSRGLYSSPGADRCHITQLLVSLVSLVVER